MPGQAIELFVGAIEFFEEVIELVEVQVTKGFVIVVITVAVVIAVTEVVAVGKIVIVAAVVIVVVVEDWVGIVVGGAVE